MVMATNIRREAVIDSWSTIIEQAAGQDKRLMEDMTRFITEANMPDVTLVRDECTMGMFGSKRDLLILKHEQHREYRMFLGARDFGANLDASWFLTYVPIGFGRRVPQQNLNIFTQQDLRAFVSVAHHCMKKAIELLCEGQQTPAGLNNSSTGFLTVW
jgi:hypothetical protein